MSIIDMLSTDRTGGSYNVSDLNRVGEAVEYLSALLNACGYKNVTFPKTDWTEDDLPTASQMRVYLDNIRALINSYYVMQSTPELPDSMDNLTYQKANDIEKILVDIERLIQNMVPAYQYGNTFYGGDHLFLLRGYNL